MCSSIVFYGERGLVNGLVLELSGNLGLTKTFLKSINFCGSASPGWIDNLQTAHFLVEPSFSEFGNPDLIMICDCMENQKPARKVVFLEAKIVKYDDSAAPLKETDAKAIQGISSRINAQLTLRYRLSRVLGQRKGKGSPVKETKKAWAAYACYPYESSKRPRRLLKSSALKLCDEFMLGVNDFWFVTLSSDNDWVVPYDKPELRPLLLDSDGQDLWDKLKDHFGLIVFDQLDTILNPTGVYSRARKYFLPPTTIQTGGAASPPPAGAPLRTENWNTFSKEMGGEFREGMRQIIEKAIAAVFGLESGRVGMVPYEGSVSYRLDRRTVIKMVPRHNGGKEVLILAVLAGAARAAGVAGQYFPDGPFMIGIGDKAREFIGRAFKELPDTGEEEDYVWALEMILQLAAVQ